GFPSNARLFIPDFVAGSDAVVPTAGGDLGLPQRVGQYLPGSGTLLLARVFNADINGAGGTLAPLVPANPGPLLLSPVSELSLTGGAGYAVYEVVDANNAAPESVQFPTFIGLPALSPAAVAQETASFAPISTITSASSSAPVLRFKPRIPTSD